MALIVIAEDEFLVADLLITILDDAGHTVVSAAHGKAALELVRKVRPDLVITDFMMPLLTGLELAEAIRADAELAGLPVILVSGAQGSIGRSKPNVFDAVLDKPYEEMRLLATIDALLATKGA